MGKAKVYLNGRFVFRLLREDCDGFYANIKNQTLYKLLTAAQRLTISFLM